MRGPSVFWYVRSMKKSLNVQPKTQIFYGIYGTRSFSDRASNPAPWGSNLAFVILVVVLRDF